MKYALDTLEHSEQHVFISGRAGTGKSTLLQLFRQTSHKRIAVVAPTGVAALNVKGQTIHSFFRFAPRLMGPSDIKKARNRSLYKKLEILVVDEISMVRADMFDNMDLFLRLNRDDPRPFGGVRVVVFGDLFQLPPVIAGDFERQYLAERYKTPYFFSSRAFKSILTETETIELNTVYRQNERHFINLLDRIRLKQLDWEDLDDLNQRITPTDDVQKGSITLTTRNKVVQSINTRELAVLEEEPITFYATIKGQFDPRVYPTDADLVLKRGAQVMTLKNDPQRRYVNGTIGEVIDIDVDRILLEVVDAQEEIKQFELERDIWEMIRYKWNAEKKEVEAEVIGSFEQYPLKLAWAMTIHKSQGKTFDKVFIDMAGGAFEFGQTYVALSRCRTLHGVQLKSALSMDDVLVDQRIVDFYEWWRR
ncbi:MAG: AAA family ATPase [Bacteroidota bacterium]